VKKAGAQSRVLEEARIRVEAKGKPTVPMMQAVVAACRAHRCDPAEASDMSKKEAAEGVYAKLLADLGAGGIPWDALGVAQRGAEDDDDDGEEGDVEGSGDEEDDGDDDDDDDDDDEGGDEGGGGGGENKKGDGDGDDDDAGDGSSSEAGGEEETGEDESGDKEPTQKRHRSRPKKFDV